MILQLFFIGKQLGDLYNCFHLDIMYAIEDLFNTIGVHVYDISLSSTQLMHGNE